ncbi:MAG: bifunctional 3-deoxy-7-phosphoheptulonate synthase/chorismate mutase [Luteibaculaceae bacterium]
MIIQLEPNCTEKQLLDLENILQAHHIKHIDISTQFARYWVCLQKKDFDLRLVGNLPYVKDVHQVTDSYKLVSRQWKINATAIDLGDNVVISEQNFTVMAGPCSIESEAQVEKITDELVKQGVRIMRGGVFKPRSSPYSFRGLGIDGLKMFHEICSRKGIKIITEVMQVSQIEEMAPYVDIFQVGARNTQNFNLLDALGGIDKPVLVKRGISGSIDELLQSAEYIFSAGNEKLMLCERGIRTFENAYRNTFDINAIPILKQKSHLPVIADPSHGIGLRQYVSKIALASLAAGADGAIIEMHYQPEEAFSDGQQNLNFMEFEQLIQQIQALKTVLA